MFFCLRPFCACVQLSAATIVCVRMWVLLYIFIGVSMPIGGFLYLCTSLYVCVCVFFYLVYGFLVCFCAFMSVRFRLRNMSLFAAVYNACLYMFFCFRLYVRVCYCLRLQFFSYVCVYFCILLWVSECLSAEGDHPLVIPSWVPFDSLSILYL